MQKNGKMYKYKKCISDKKNQRIVTLKILLILIACKICKIFMLMRNFKKQAKNYD